MSINANFNTTSSRVFEKSAGIYFIVVDKVNTPPANKEFFYPYLKENDQIKWSGSFFEDEEDAIDTVVRKYHAIAQDLQPSETVTWVDPDLLLKHPKNDEIYEEDEETEKLRIQLNVPSPYISNYLVTPTGDIIHGNRRNYVITKEINPEAVKKMGDRKIKLVPVIVRQYPSELEEVTAMALENQYRENKSRIAKLNEAALIRARIEAQSAERKRQGRAGNFSEAEKGRTRDLVAKSVGMKPTEYRISSQIKDYINKIKNKDVRTALAKVLNNNVNAALRIQHLRESADIELDDATTIELCNRVLQGKNRVSADTALTEIYQERARLKASRASKSTSSSSSRTKAPASLTETDSPSPVASPGAETDAASLTEADSPSPEVSPGTEADSPSPVASPGAETDAANLTEADSPSPEVSPGAETDTANLTEADSPSPAASPDAETNATSLTEADSPSPAASPGAETNATSLTEADSPSPAASPGAETDTAVPPANLTETDSPDAETADDETEKSLEEMTLDELAAYAIDQLRDDPEDNRLSPPGLFSRCLEVINRQEFDLDPFADITNPKHIPALKAYTILDDAFNQPIEGDVYACIPSGKQAKCMLLFDRLIAEGYIKRLFVISSGSMVNVNSCQNVIKKHSMAIAHWRQPRLDFIPGYILEFDYKRQGKLKASVNNQNETCIAFYSHDSQDMNRFAEVFDDVALILFQQKSALQPENPVWIGTECNWHGHQLKVELNEDGMWNCLFDNELELILPSEDRAKAFLLSLAWTLK